MNLYLISQNINDGYDTFDSAVVAAESEEQARHTSPDLYRKWNKDVGAWAFMCSDGEEKIARFSSWVHPEHVIVELIGTTNKPAGLILASFNAG